MICRDGIEFHFNWTIAKQCFPTRRSSHLHLWLWLRLHLGLDHPHLRLRRPPHLRQRVRGDLLQGEAGGGGRGGGDGRGVDQIFSTIPFLPPRKSSPCRHSKPSKAGGAASQSSSCWCRCSSWCSSTASTHLRSCTNAATHPEDAVKLFILFHDWVVGYSSSVLKLYQFMNCPKTSHPDLPKLYQWPMLESRRPKILL